MVESDDYLVALAAINYKQLEVERMINPMKVEEYYPEDPFEGFTAEEMTKILMDSALTDEQIVVELATRFPVGEFSEYQPPDFTPIDPFDNWDNYKPSKEI